MSNLSVAVIGAGAAGLCAARHLSALGWPGLRLRVFEQAEFVGGTWVYTDTVDTDTRGLPVHSSMYSNLRTNLPKEVMAFPDFPFQHLEESFVHHSQVLDYLKQYCEHFKLEKFIKFNTVVEKVRPADDTKWTVTTKCLKTSEESVQEFDSVMVCNGHYSVPVVPSIPGLDTFTGQVIHSHNYRRPEDFKDRSVIILGGGASGTDISIELSASASSVYLAHNNPPLPTVLPDNVHQVRGVKECLGDQVFLLNDDTRIEAGVILLATGYHYTFPFLAPDCGVTVSQRRVSPLFKHLVNINRPSMCFVGIPIQICPFPQFDLQIRYFVKTISGQIALPSKAEMLDSLQKEEEWRREELGLPDKYFHKMGTLQWRYNKEMAALGDLEPICDGVENLYNAVHERRRQGLPFYKKDKYSLVGKEGYEGFIFDNKNGKYSRMDPVFPKKDDPLFIV